MHASYKCELQLEIFLKTNLYDLSPLSVSDGAKLDTTLQNSGTEREQRTEG